MSKAVKLNWNDLAGILGWILAILVPIAIFYELHIHNFDQTKNYFITFFSSALILWMFRLVHYLLPAILLVAFCLLLNVVPQTVILSGFISKSFFLVLTFSFLGAIILKANLLLRPVLWLLARIPSRMVWLEAVLYFMGFFSSAIINVQTNRFDITVPLYRDLMRESNLTTNPIARGCLSMALYAGTIYFSELFLTGKATNLPILEMLPQQTQLHFTWINWLIAASVPVIIMQALLLIIFFVFFHRPVHFTIDRADLKKRLSALGKFSFAEIIAIMGIILLIVGIILSSLHIVQLAWFSLALLFFLLLFPILNKNEFRSYINWAFLLYLGAIIGIVQGIHYLNVDSLILNAFPALFVWATKNIYAFIIIVFFICMVSTFLIGSVASIILLLSILLPLAAALDISPWILAFVIAVSCEAWFIPYQSTYHLYFEELVENDAIINVKKIIQMNLIFIPCRFIGLLLAVFYWRYLGLL